eukprot:s36_g50.t1
MFQDEAAKEAAKAKKAAEKAEKSKEKESGRKRRRADKPESDTKKNETKRKGDEPSGGSVRPSKRVKRDSKKPSEERPDEVVPPAAGPDSMPPADGPVSINFQRLQPTGVAHFKVEIGSQKSFTIKAPNGKDGSSVGVILSGSGSFYVYKAIDTKDLGKLKAGI